jgi:hypothetical protein
VACSRVGRAEQSTHAILNLLEPVGNDIKKRTEGVHDNTLLSVMLFGFVFK